MDQRLKNMTIEFLDDIIYSPNLLPAEHKAASQLLRLITREEPEHVKVDLNVLLAPPMVIRTVIQWIFTKSQFSEVLQNHFLYSPVLK
jgi:hypothetical protein